MLFWKLAEIKYVFIFFYFISVNNLFVISI